MSLLDNFDYDLEVNDECVAQRIQVHSSISFENKLIRDKGKIRSESPIHDLTLISKIDKKMKYSDNQVHTTTMPTPYKRKMALIDFKHCSGVEEDEANNSLSQLRNNACVPRPVRNARQLDSTTIMSKLLQ